MLFVVFHFAVATISADQIEYAVNEANDLWITLHLDGQKGPGRECIVTVMTVDGSATGKSRSITCNHCSPKTR